MSHTELVPIGHSVRVTHALRDGVFFVQFLDEDTGAVSAIPLSEEQARRVYEILQHMFDTPEPWRGGVNP